MNAPPTASHTTALRGALISCRDDPFLTNPATAFHHEPDGLVVCRDGVIVAAGAFAAVKAQLPPDAIIDDYRAVA